MKVALSSSFPLLRGFNDKKVLLFDSDYSFGILQYKIFKCLDNIIGLFES